MTPLSRGRTVIVSVLAITDLTQQGEQDMTCKLCQWSTPPMQICHLHRKGKEKNSSEFERNLANDAHKLCNMPNAAPDFVEIEEITDI